jgi:hypothetical protein
VAGTVAPSAWRWALYREPPEAGDDYRILMDSTAGAARAEFAAFIRRLLPGSSTPDGLPWVVFGGHLSAQAGPRLGMCVIEHRSAPTARYFDAAFPTDAPAAFGYDEFFHSLREQSLPPQFPLSTPARLTTADRRPAVAALRSDFDWYADLAAALLEGPVTLTGAAPADLAGRVLALETVMSLLPYGMRAVTVAATHADSRAVPEVDLAFGPADGTRRCVDWADRASPRLGSGAKDYALRLRELRAAHDGGAAGVVDLLRRITTPLAVDEGTALEALVALGFAGLGSG